MPDHPVVDAHVHLCNPGRIAYRWAEALPALARSVLPEHLTAAADPVEVDCFVFVEVDAEPPGHLTEAAWVANLAEGDARLQGLVASAPLERGPHVEEQLEQLRRHRVLRGIRRLIQNEPDPDFCLRPGFIAGLKLLPSYDLTFDICVLHHQLPKVCEMVRACPEVRFVLDHVGKPVIRNELFEPWGRNLRLLAAEPNVHCKLSGLTSEADHRDWTFDQLLPYIVHAIECFGFDRVIYGGDWHFSELAGSYRQWVEILDWATADASAEERRKLFRDNAIRFYRLNS